MTYPRVCLDARMIHHSGIGTHIRGIVEGFRREPVEGGEVGDSPTPIFTFLGNPEILQRYEAFTHQGSVTSWKAPIYSVREQLTMPHCKGDLYHFPHYNVPQILRPRLPLVVTIHDLIHLLIPEVGGSPARRLAARYLMTSAVHRAAAVLTVSEASRRDIISHLHVPEEKITVTPNAVAPAFQPVGLKELERIKADLKLPSRYLLSVGINKPHKNLIFLIKTYLRWRELKPDYDYALVLCGLNETDQRQLRQLVSENADVRSGDMIHFVSYLRHDQMPGLYQGAEALIFPSLYEGFGLPLLEAQRVGTPVLASHTSSLPEVGGDSVMYFDPRNADDLIRCLNELLEGGDSLRKEISDAGHSNEGRFCWKATCDLIGDVYRQVV